MLTPRPLPWAIAAGLFLLAGLSFYVFPPAGSDGGPLVAYDFSRVTLAEFIDCMDGEALILSAHRGGPGDRRPENALSTLAATVRATPAFLEVDVAQSSDGVLFLFHDDTLDRTTDWRGNINRPWAELREIQLVDAEGRVSADRIPSLDAVLRWAHARAVLQLDRKRGVSWEDIAVAVRAADVERSVITIAYTVEDAAEIHAALPNTVISVPADSMRELDRYRALGIPEHLLLAWTGTDDDWDLSHYAALDARDVPVIHAAFDRAPDGPDLPEDVAQAADQAFASGVDVLAVNQPRATWRHLTRDGQGADLLADYALCLGGE